MGVTTDYLGRIDLVPALNRAERDYLLAFSRSRRCWRSDGPYAVTPPDPDDATPASASRQARDAAVERGNRIADRQPSLYCQWVPCDEGCCLGWDGIEKFYRGPHWMQYLIDHFLRPGAAAMDSGDPQFSGFTFDHVANGVMAGRQQDNRELFLIHVEDNEVGLEVLQQGDPMPWDVPGGWWSPESLN